MRRPRRNSAPCGSAGGDRAARRARRRASRRRAGRRSAAPGAFVAKRRGRPAHRRPCRERARFEQDLRAVADAEHEFSGDCARRSTESIDAIVRGDRAGAHAILVGKAARQHVGIVSAQRSRRGSNARARASPPQSRSKRTVSSSVFVPGKTRTAMRALTDRTRAAARPGFDAGRRHVEARAVDDELRTVDRLADLAAPGKIDRRYRR